MRQGLHIWWNIWKMKVLHFALIAKKVPTHESTCWSGIVEQVQDQCGS